MYTYDRKLLFSVPELKTRGWTSSGISKFSPEPDDMRPNPRFSSAGGPMKFYLISRVEALERTPEFQKWLSKSNQRKTAALRTVETKEQKLLDYVDEIEIEVPSLTPEELINRAVAHYNEHWAGTGKFAHVLDSPEFLVRIQVNYLRHELTRTASRRNSGQKPEHTRPA